MAEKKKISVLMVCAMGMSSSLIEQRTSEVAENAGVPFEIKALEISEIGRWDFKENPVDLILIAPQARFKKRSLEQAADPHGILVENMDSVAYGMIDAEKIFEQIMTAIKNRDAKK